MSTIPILLEHEQIGQNLCRFNPTLRGHEKKVRKLTLATDVHSWLGDDRVSSEMLRVKSQSRAHFSEFVRGEPVDDLDFMKRVEDRRFNPPRLSDGVWAMRARFEDPQHRFFGLFAIRDWFVVLAKRRRDTLQTDADWHAEIDRALKAWAELFPGRQPWVRDTLTEYLSNEEKRDDRW